MGRRWRLMVLAGLFTLVSGCGSSGDGGDGVASVSSPSSAPSSAPAGGGSGDDGTPDIDQMRAYAKCMREHGIDMADPDPDSGGGGISVGSDAEKQKVDKANDACKHLMPNGGKPDKPTPEDLDKARATAKCLREHGVNVKEPTMEEPGISVDAGAGDADKVNQAMEACAPKGAHTETQSGGSR